MRYSLTTLLVLVGLGCAYPRKETHTVPLPDSAVSAADTPRGLWTMEVISAELPPRMASGLDWDRDSGKEKNPDPFVRLYVDDRMVWQSETVKDTSHPTWNATLPKSVYIPRTSTMRLEVWDRDTTVSADPMGAVYSQGLPGNALPNADARLTLDNLANVTIRVRPPKPYRGVGLGVEIHPDELLITGIAPFSPASRADLHVGERIVAIGGATITELTDNDAFSRLSLAIDRATPLTVADSHGTQREVILDKKPLWIVM